SPGFFNLSIAFNSSLKASASTGEDNTASNPASKAARLSSACSSLAVAMSFAFGMSRRSERPIDAVIPLLALRGPTTASAGRCAHGCCLYFHPIGHYHPPSAALLPSFQLCRPFPPGILPFSRHSCPCPFAAFLDSRVWNFPTAHPGGIPLLLSH